MRFTYFLIFFTLFSFSISAAFEDEYPLTQVGNEALTTAVLQDDDDVDALLDEWFRRIGQNKLFGNIDFSAVRTLMGQEKHIDKVATHPGYAGFFVTHENFAAMRAPIMKALRAKNPGALEAVKAMIVRNFNFAGHVHYDSRGAGSKALIFLRSMREEDLVDLDLMCFLLPSLNDKIKTTEDVCKWLISNGYRLAPEDAGMRCLLQALKNGSITTLENFDFSGLCSESRVSDFCSALFYQNEEEPGLSFLVPFLADFQRLFREGNSFIYAKSFLSVWVSVGGFGCEEVWPLVIQHIEHKNQYHPQSALDRANAVLGFLRYKSDLTAVENFVVGKLVDLIERQKKDRCCFGVVESFVYFSRAVMLGYREALDQVSNRLIPHREYDKIAAKAFFDFLTAKTAEGDLKYASVLSKMYAYGIGCEQNDAQAKHWKAQANKGSGKLFLE